MFFCSLWLNYTNAQSESYIALIEQKQSSLTSQQKTDYQKKLFALLSLQALRFRNNTQQLAMITPIQEYFMQQLRQKTSAISPLSSEIEATSTITLSTQIPNVDMERVRDVWLQLHNEERSNQWLAPFTYNFALESTATTWVNYLGSIRDTTHTRNSGDGYYSYSAIKQWFLDQWIIFSGKEQNGQTLFTENLWWNVYSCKKTDCTDDFIIAVKKSWTFFMSEKWKSYKPHYNAIVGDYSNIGLGIALSGTRYYLVSHYAQDLK